MDLITNAFLLIVCGMLASVVVPARWLNQHASKTRRFVVAALFVQFALAAMMAVRYWVSREVLDPSVSLGQLGGIPVNLTIYLDGPSTLMLALACFVGLIVSRFSVRYLDGETAQGKYFRWLGFTVAAISFMLVAGNLAMYLAGSFLTSAGLHRLLVHYSDRKAAHRAAWMKFFVSRIGDAFLVAAMMLIYRSFGTWEFSSLFEQAAGISASDQASGQHAMIAWLLVLSGMAKSAQFPFHTWLPETMETPTPVSALMHAGIVNAGGYLIIRLSPLVVLNASSLAFLAVIGALTAGFAGIVMMTQSSIKRSLAYSTIAQMGFMMFQCGLGSFSSAMMHLLVHSLYKAHAFLGSGSVLSEPSSASSGWEKPSVGTKSVASLGIAAAIVLAAYLSIAWVIGGSILTKPGGIVLGCVFCLALTTWGWRLLDQPSRKPRLIGLVGIASLSLVYIASFLAIDNVIKPSLPTWDVSLPAYAAVLCLLAVSLIPLLLHVAVLKGIRPVWLDRLRIHAVNGFYVDALYQRFFTSVAKS